MRANLPPTFLQQVVSKLGLLDTSRTAWESDVHDIVWKGLKKEYELEQRFENLLKKVRGERGWVGEVWMKGADKLAHL